jgi:hypothetical protein
MATSPLAIVLAAIGAVVLLLASGAAGYAAGVWLATAGLAWMVIAAVVLAAIVLALYWLIFRVHRLDLALIGLSAAKNIPAIPFWLSQLPDTIVKLLVRRRQMEQALEGLSSEWRIGGISANGYTFMGLKYSDATARALDPRTRLFLDRPDQFAMAWTTLGNVAESATKKWLPTFSAALADAAASTREFFPTMAKFGLAYNLIILRRIDPADAQLKAALGADWTERMEAVWHAGDLYVIDMTFFAAIAPSSVNFFPRVTPATLTLLRRNPATRDINPFAIRVRDPAGAWVQYLDADPAWIYALQAARTSIGVWGIWLGHVYHWHIVTAAMQMTMFQNLSALHPVRQVFGRQSDFLIAFDQFLLLNWSVAPPTSLSTSVQFLGMIDAYARGRNFSDDDPLTTLAALGLREADFSEREPWDQYPVVRYLLFLWRATERYVGSVVEAFYADDAAVANDAALKRWITASAAPSGGNVRGLPAMTTRTALKSVLTSLIYRVTAHGASRLNQAANPALAFVGNFPPCLQMTSVPSPASRIVFRANGNAPPGTLSLADFLPNTGTIGEMTTFLFTFVYSPPYIPFIPPDGIAEDLPFVGASGIGEVCNQALIRYRKDLRAFIDLYAASSDVAPAPAQIHQWELNIET